MKASVTVAEDMTKYAAFASMDVQGPLSNLLRDLDFRGIIHEKCEQLMDNSRHWFFDEIRDWSRIPIVEDSKRKLFWLMGAGGTGKSVISAELLRRGLMSPEKAGCKIIAWYVLALLLQGSRHTQLHTYTYMSMHMHT